MTSWPTPAFTGPKATQPTSKSVAAVFAMMSVVCHTKEMRHRVWYGFEARLTYTVTAFNWPNGMA